MRRFAGTVALVIPFLAALACGGRVGVVGGGGDGGTCPGCVVQCPLTNEAQPGSACDLATQGPCTVPYTYTGCNGIALTASCSCQSDGQGSGVWACNASPEPDCPDAQPPACPDPSSVVQGNGCDVSPQLSCDSETPAYDCNGNVVGDESCQCFGGSWSCITSEPDCPPPTCPDPQTVEQGVSCASSGSQCPGNPTECDGAIFYDAFECVDGAWNDVAVTGCSGSGSSGGGSGSSGGGGVDAGPPDAKGI
jgi:hypothetical protein